MTCTRCENIGAREMTTPKLMPMSEEEIHLQIKHSSHWHAYGQKHSDCLICRLILAWIEQTVRAEKAEFITYHGFSDSQCTACIPRILDSRHRWTNTEWITAVKVLVGWKDE